MEARFFGQFAAPIPRCGGSRENKAKKEGRLQNAEPKLADDRANPCPDGK